VSDNAQPAIVDFLRKQPITDETTVAGLLNNLESAFPENDVDDFAAAMEALGGGYTERAGAIREFVAAHQQDLGEIP